MMVLESIVTGWSTTKCCVTRLQRWALRRPETSLNVQWFKSDETQAFVVDGDKSHIKFMVVDEELVIVGSSNLDRASACTSGEVNVAISNSEFAHQILAAIKRHQRTDFRSTESIWSWTWLAGCAQRIRYSSWTKFIALYVSGRRHTLSEGSGK